MRKSIKNYGFGKKKKIVILIPCGVVLRQRLDKQETVVTVVQQPLL